MVYQVNDIDFKVLRLLKSRKQMLSSEIAEALSIERPAIRTSLSKLTGWKCVDRSKDKKGEFYRTKIGIRYYDYLYSFSFEGTIKFLEEQKEYYTRGNYRAEYGYSFPKNKKAYDNLIKDKRNKDFSDFGFSYQDGCFIYNPEYGNDRGDWPYSNEETETLVISAFNYLGIKELSDIKIIIPKRGIRKLRQNIEYPPSLTFKYFVNYFIGSYGDEDWTFAEIFLKKYRGFSFQTRYSKTEMVECIHDLLLGLIDGDKTVTIGTDRYFIKMSVDKVFDNWGKMKGFLLKGVSSDFLNHSLCTRIYYQEERDFLDLLSSCITSDEVREMYAKYEKKHLFYGDDGFRIFSIGRKEVYKCFFFKDIVDKTYKDSEIAREIEILSPYLFFYQGKDFCEKKLYEASFYLSNSVMDFLKQDKEYEKFTYEYFVKRVISKFSTKIANIGNSCGEIINFFFSLNIVSKDLSRKYRCVYYKVRNPLYALIYGGDITFTLPSVGWVRASLKTFCDLWEYIDINELCDKRSYYTWFKEGFQQFNKKTKNLFTKNKYEKFRTELRNCENSLDVAILFAKTKIYIQQRKEKLKLK